MEDPELTGPINTRGGRPIKQENEKRCLQANVRFTIAEYNKLKADSDKAGITVADLIRRGALNITIVVPKEKSYARLTHEINRLGNSANQIARRLNSGSSYRETWEYVAKLCSKALDRVANDP